MTAPAASPIADALVTVLSAGSDLGAQAVSKDDYMVLMSSSIAAVVDWTNLQATKMTMGSDLRYQWTFTVSLFIRETHDPVATKQRVWSVGDKIAKACADNQTLLDTVKDINSFSMSRRPGEAFTLPAGDTWLPIDLSITVTEWDN